MNYSKLTLSAFLLGVALFTTAPANASDMCENSVAAICTDTKEQRIENDKNVARIYNEILDQADPIITARVNAYLKKTPKIRWIKRITEPLRIQNKVLMDIAKKKFPEIDSFINNKDNQNRIKGYMYGAIDNASFNTSTKYTMKAVINQVRMVSFSEYIDLAELDESLLKNSFRNGCGSSGLEVNAFAINIKKKGYVVICPGFLINNSYGKSEAEMFDNSLFVLGHELGHHIDSGAMGVETYNQYISCMSAKHASKFNRSRADDKYCGKKKTSTQECNTQVVVSHAGELIGDVWGMKIINEMAKEQALGIFESSQLLVNGMNPLCDTGDVGLHPSGAFRTGTHIAISPDMNNLFQCQNTKHELTCNF